MAVLPQSKKDPCPSGQGSFYDLKLIETLVAVLAGSLALLATLHAGALVVLSLAHLGDNAGLGAATLKALQSAVQRLVLSDVNFRHL